MKLRPIGKVTSDLEAILDEMTDAHDMQWHEVLSLVHGWLQTHAPHQQEEYLDGSNPTFYYGPKDNK